MGQAHALLWKPPEAAAAPLNLFVPTFQPPPRESAANRRIDEAEAARRKGDVATARALCVANLAEDPSGFVANVLMAMLESGCHRPDAAMRHLAQVQTSIPDVATAQNAFAQTRVIELLRQGDLAGGMPLLETVCPPLASRPWTEWRGQDLAGKSLLIIGEYGFGDQIQFARFAPYLRDAGAEVHLTCEPELHRLFQSLGVTVWSDREPPRTDYWASCTGVAAQIGGAELAAAPYLRALCALTPPGGYRIGVKTAGHPDHVNDKLRSLPVDLAAELLALPGAMDLDPNVTGAADFSETAMLVAGLEVVVTVDTSVAHLAGALGKPVWIMLPAFDTDWRWMRDRTDSPWYPSATLYRQDRPGDWAGVIERVKRDAAALLNPQKITA